MIKPPTWIILVALILIIAWFNLKSFKNSTFPYYKGKEGMMGTTVPTRPSYCIPSGTQVNMYGSSVCCSGSALQRNDAYYCK